MRKMFKSSLILVMLVMVCFAASVSAAQLVLTPVDDAYVHDGEYATQNFGTADLLNVKLETEREGFTRMFFLKFDISEVTAVQKATLRLYVVRSDVLELKQIAFYDITGEAWSENEITWENAPRTSGTFIKDVFTDNFSNVWFEVNLTDFVKKHVEAGTKEISIRVEHLSDHWGGIIQFASKEAENNHPELVITY